MAPSVCGAGPGFALRIGGRSCLRLGVQSLDGITRFTPGNQHDSVLFVLDRDGSSKSRAHPYVYIYRGSITGVQKRHRIKVGKEVLGSILGSASCKNRRNNPKLNMKYC